MVEVNEIDGRDKLEEWLKDKPQEWAVWIAHRAAMRVLPLGWPWFRTDKAREFDLTEMPLLWASLISGVAANGPTSDINAAADAASDASDAAAAAAAFAATSAASAAAFAADAAAANAAFASDASDAAAAAFAAAANAAFAAFSDAVWTAIQDDCSALRDTGLSATVALWHEGENPFQSEWITLKRSLPRSPAGASDETARAPVAEDWSFWIKWYDAALDGKAMKPAMLEEIALIPESAWKKGPAVVNPLIVDIVEKYEGGKGTALSRTSTYEFSFDPVNYWMKLVGFEGDLRNIDDPGKVKAFEGDIEELQEKLQDFIDYARDHLAGSNQGSAAVVAAEKLLAELQRVSDRKEIRARALIQKGAYFNSFAQEIDAEAVFGKTLSGMLDDTIDLTRQITHTHLATGLAQLGPLKELELGDRSPSDVLARIKAARERMRVEAGKEWVGLSPEGEAAFDQMLEDLEEIESLIGEAQTDDRKAHLRKRFAERVGAFGATAGHYIEKGKAHADKATGFADGLIKMFKRWKSLQDILDWYSSLGGGGLP